MPRFELAFGPCGKADTIFSQRSALRDQIYYRPEDPAVRARLYVAGFRRGKG